MQSIKYILPALILASAVACSSEKPPIYEATPDSLYNGSLYYASSEYNCKSCHGTQWDGNGPEAKNLEKDGIKVPSFTDATPPEITPVDYFKAMTVGTANTKKLPSGHAFQSHTDRGRWAMANFLYSLAPAVATKDQAKRQEAMTKAMEEAKQAYSESRRWNMGFVPLAERPKSPKLEDMKGYNPVPSQQ